MIVVRDIFQLHFGKAREALELTRRAFALERRNEAYTTRVLTDLTGEYYTLVVESEYPGLAEMEAALARSFQDPEWQRWYAQFTPLVRSGRREIFRIAYAAQAVAPMEATVAPAPA